MAFQLSPGVLVTEKDLTNIVPAVATSEAGLVGVFEWGPADEVVVLSNEEELRTIFGKPTTATYKWYFTAANFLSYSNHLKIVRATDGTNACIDANLAKSIKNTVERDALSATTDSTAQFYAKYPSSLGNSLQVVVVDHGSWSAGSDTTAYNTYFNGAPGTSIYGENLDASNDEIHIAVIDEDGEFSGSKGTLLEVFQYLSKSTDAIGTDGNSIYYKDYINNNSQYIICTELGNSSALDLNWDTTCANVVFESLIDTETSGYIKSFSGGATGTGTDALALTAIADSLEYLSNPDEVDLSLWIAGPVTATEAGTIIDYCDTRKDCVAFISPEYDDVVNTNDQSTKAAAVVAFKDSLTSSSYYVMDSGWKQQYDKYNDVNRWIPLCGDIAGLCARTDLSNDPWWSPAGYNRGKIKNCIKLAYNPSKTSRDTLYKDGVNPVITEAGEGHLLFGDKTGLSKPSSFDRINVRRLFIVLEKAIAIAAKYQLFEFNDEFTRAMFVNMVSPYLRDVQGRRGIQAFKVVCDETNNTDVVINRNDFIADIYINPARSINTIQLNFIATNSQVSFEESIV